MATATLGVIIGNRDFFPDQLVTEARGDIGEVFRELDIQPVMLGENETKLGGVETDDELQTFGSRAVAHVPKLQKLMQFVCNNEFEHHVAVNCSKTAGVLAEALETYLNWDVYYHQRPEE